MVIQSSGSRAIPLPVACHDRLDYEDGWWPHHSKCFDSLLMVPESDDVILPNQLTSLPHYTQVVLKAEREYGQYCLLFKMGQPTHLIPLGMTGFRVFVILLAKTGRSSRTSQAGPSSPRCPVASLTP